MPAARNSLGDGAAGRGTPRATRWPTFTEVVRPSPEYLPAHYNLGNALLAAGRPAEAIAQFEFVLAPHAAGRGGAQRPGQRAGDERDALPEAQQAFERSLALNASQRAGPLQPRAHRRAGADDLADAEAHFERALAIDPADPRHRAGARAGARGAEGAVG